MFHCLFITTFARCLSTSLYLNLSVGALHRPVPVRRRFRIDQVDQASLEPGGSATLGAEGELVWCCLEMAGPEGQSSSAGASINGFY